MIKFVIIFTLILSGCAGKKYLKNCEKVGEVDGQAVFGKCEKL